MPHYWCSLSHALSLQTVLALRARLGNGFVQFVGLQYFLQPTLNSVSFSEISEVDNKMKSSEPFLLSYVNNFLSFLLVVPVCFNIDFVGFLL